MRENFLHYIWRYQYFDKLALKTCSQETLNILQPGTLNHHAGPDFLNASMVINGITWHGHVEIHIQASAWQQHRHQENPAYDNVVLHVAWHNNQPIQHADGTLLPTLALKNLVATDLIERYEQLVHNETPIPCAHQLPEVSDIVKTSMLDKALFQRLTHKHNLVYKLLKRNNHNWEATAYQLLAYNFGFKINSNNFLDLSLRIPFTIIQKNQDQWVQLEALFF